MAKIYSENQIQAAKQTDLIDFLKRTENFDFVQSGKSFRCVQHDSLVVTSDRQKFFFNSKNISGSAIDWLMKVQNNKFQEAMQKLVGEPNATFEYGSHKKAETTEKVNIVQKVPDKKPFVLPEKAESNNKVLAYLIKTRGIEPAIVKDLLKQGKLYQDTHIAD